MKALSLTQPWATLVAIGAKRLETRSWRSEYRGPLAIHASKSFPGEDQELCSDEPFVGALRRGGYDLITSPYRSNPYGWAHLLPLGAIVAVGVLAGVVRVPATPGYVCGTLLPPGEPEASFGNYEPGRDVWRLVDVRALPEPVPCRGALGLWTVPPDVLARIEHDTASRRRS